MSGARASGPGERLLHPGEVAEILHVAPKTVARWAKEGKLPCWRTLGGHRRYPERQIRLLAAAMDHLRAAEPAPWQR